VGEEEADDEQPAHLGTSVLTCPAEQRRLVSGQRFSAAANMQNDPRLYALEISGFPTTGPTVVSEVQISDSSAVGCAIEEPAWRSREGTDCS
jgi:hypothetical protein